MQSTMVTTGLGGIWIYNFLNRVLIPTGLHHFIWMPFLYGPAIVEEGSVKYWLQHLNEFAQSSQPIKELFPEGGFMMFGLEKLIAPFGIAAAFYFTAKPEKKKQVLALLIPASLTAILTSITEPFEFTFLFVAPVLFVIYALISATMNTLMYALGVSGNFNAVLFEWISQNWIPLFHNHWPTYLLQITIAIVFVFIYFFVFKLLIERYNFATPA